MSSKVFKAGVVEGSILAIIDMIRVAAAREQIPVMTDRSSDIYG